MVDWAISLHFPPRIIVWREKQQNSWLRLCACVTVVKQKWSRSFGHVALLQPRSQGLSLSCPSPTPPPPPNMLGGRRETPGNDVGPAVVRASRSTYCKTCYLWNHLLTNSLFLIVFSPPSPTPTHTCTSELFYCLREKINGKFRQHPPPPPFLWWKWCVFGLLAASILIWGEKSYFPFYSVRDFRP